MAVKIRGIAPYAPSSAVIELLKRNRDSGMPEPVTLTTLERLGISESLRPRTLQTLKLLDFVGEEGNLAPDFANLRKVQTPDYLPTVAEMLRGTYADVFAVVNPSNATYEQVKDAFRGFNPASQIDRMTSLFLGLLEYTKQWERLPSSRSGAATSTPQPRKSTAAKSATTRNPRNPPPLDPPPPPANGDTYGVTLESGGTVSVVVDVNLFQLSMSDREFVIGLVDKLTGYRQGDQSTSQGERAS